MHGVDDRSFVRGGLIRRSSHDGLIHRLEGGGDQIWQPMRALQSEYSTWLPLRLETRSPRLNEGNTGGDLRSKCLSFICINGAKLHSTPSASSLDIINLQ